MNKTEETSNSYGNSFVLENSPALIESLLPVQKISIDSYKEQMAVQGKMLTSLGSYWKGRKPLVLNRACVLASLLPATDNPIKDLEIFELLMGMDDISMSKRLGLPKPEEIIANASISDIHAYFVIEPKIPGLPNKAPFDISSLKFFSDGKEKNLKVKWRDDITDSIKHEIAALLITSKSYSELATQAKRAEEISEEISSHIWDQVNAHLNTSAKSLSELVEQLGFMRFGHRPKIADTFSGSGQIPFAAAQLGCDVLASDLNPVACMLTWGAFNIVGASVEQRKIFEEEQARLVSAVKAEIDRLNIESDGLGWRGKVYLYCLEVTCPSSGWKVPVLPTLLISKGQATYAKLVPIPSEKRYHIELVYKASAAELKNSEIGTYRNGNVVHTVNGVEHSNSIASIRGDFTENISGKKIKKNKLRLWDKTDIVYKEDDIFRERLYAIQWMKDLQNIDSGRSQTEFRAVTQADLDKENEVIEYVKKNIVEWQEKGWVPETRIEAGDKTDEPIRTRGWTHWHQLFNPRQLMFLGLTSKNCSSGVSYLYLARLLDWSSKLCRYGTGAQRQSVAQTFYNQALNPLFNYGVRSFEFAKGYLLENPRSSPLLTNLSITNKSAADFSLNADIFITDPPYGDAVKYEEIYEFFIAWLRKNKAPDFETWTKDSRRELAIKGEGHDFRLGMVSAYKRMAERMPDNGLQILMFTHQDGNIWADMANIVWASGLRVTAAWYLVTETDSALREGSYVKGTILLVLRKRLGAKRTNQTDLAYELEEEVAEQIKRLTGMNSVVVGDEKRAKDGNLFEDADLQMAGYAAALKVLTKYSVIDGKDMAQEALRPRLAGQKTLVESLIDFATDTANKMLVPLGLDESVWQDLEAAERFYLKMLEQESHGLNKLDNYQNFAKAFAVRDFAAMMASENANKAALKSAQEFARAEMNQSSELYQTATRSVLYALMDLQVNKDLDDVIQGVEQNMKPGSFYSSRPKLVVIARFIAKKVETMRPEEASAARVLADGIENQRL